MQSSRLATRNWSRSATLSRRKAVSWTCATKPSPTKSAAFRRLKLRAIITCHHGVVLMLLGQNPRLASQTARGLTRVHGNTEGIHFGSVAMWMQFDRVLSTNN